MSWTRREALRQRDVDAVSMGVCATREDEWNRRECGPRLRPMVDYVVYSPFSFLNLSHASFSVLNTAALIIRCSVVAFCWIWSHSQLMYTITPAID